MDVLIRVGGRGCIFNPSAKEGRFISVQVMEGGRKRENMARDQLHSMRQWCLEESVTKRRQIRALSLCRAGPAAPEGDVWWHRPLNTTFPTCAAFGLSWSSRFIVLSLVHHWAELWGILGNKIPIPSPALFESNKLPSLSQQAEDTETKKNWTLRLLIISSSCVHTVCGVHCYKKKGIKITQGTVMNMWISLLLSF